MDARVWPGVGDEQDKLVTVDVNPNSADYGKVVNTLSVGGRNEAHHSGLTDDRMYLWAGGLDTNKIFVFDVHTDPAKPKLHKTITDFVAKSGGVVGPHTLYALPGRMMITGLSNNKDHGGRTGMVEYTNDGKYVTTHWMPTDDQLAGAKKSGKYADGYGYDVRALPRLNVFVTSSFTGWNNYMMNLGKMMADAEAMKRFGNTVVVWDLHTRKPKKILDVPGAPLEIRCAWGRDHDYCFTTHGADLEDLADLRRRARRLAGRGRRRHRRCEQDPAAGRHLDLGRRHAALGRHLERRQDAPVRHHRPASSEADLRGEDRRADQHGVAELGREARVLHLVAAGELGQDRGRTGDLQFFKAYTWDGKKLTPALRHRLHKEKLGAPHQMRFGAYALYGSARRDEDVRVAEAVR